MTLSWFPNMTGLIIRIMEALGSVEKCVGWLGIVLNVSPYLAS